MDTEEKNDLYHRLAQHLAALGMGYPEKYPCLDTVTSEGDLVSLTGMRSRPHPRSGTAGGSG